MLDCIKNITITVKANISNPKNVDLVIGAVVEALKNGIKDRLQGDIGKIATQVQDPEVKGFSKKSTRCWPCKFDGYCKRSNEVVRSRLFQVCVILFIAYFKLDKRILRDLADLV